MALHKKIGLSVKGYLRTAVNRPELFTKGRSAVDPTERITNGDFSSDIGWDTAGASWTIASNQATNNVAGQPLTNSLQDAPVTNGQHFELSINIVANPAGSSIIVRLVNSSTAAFQTIYTDGTTTGIKTASGTVSGSFDELRVISVDDSGVVIDDVSLLV